MLFGWDIIVILGFINYIEHNMMSILFAAQSKAVQKVRVNALKQDIVNWCTFSSCCIFLRENTENAPWWWLNGIFRRIQWSLPDLVLWDLLTPILHRGKKSSIFGPIPITHPIYTRRLYFHIVLEFIYTI